MEKPTDNKLNAGSDIRPDVLNVDDVVKMAPKLASHRRIIKTLMRWLRIDGINRLHRDNCHTPGVDFTTGVLRQLNIKLEVDGLQNLENLAATPGAFITVSNHPFGALDGISLINLVGRYRPVYKVMVNMILNHISAMRSCFIAVDALASDDPHKRAVSVQGIKAAIKQVREGKALGFFPAGAVSKINNRLQLEDRQWQQSVIRLIMQLKVPVLPIYFHGSNSWWFNLLGRISWQLRTLRLPAEVFGKRNSTIRISVGEPITPQQIADNSSSIDALGQYLKQATYALRK